MVNRKITKAFESVQLYFDHMNEQQDQNPYFDDPRVIIPLILLDRNLCYAKAIINRQSVFNKSKVRDNIAFLKRCIRDSKLYFKKRKDDYMPYRQVLVDLIDACNIIVDRLEYLLKLNK